MSRLLWGIAGLCVCNLFLVTEGRSQDGNNPDSLAQAALDMYIDCDDCDEDYLRTEITFVNFVRDRQQADVHVLVSTQRTGAGGEEYTLEFIGLREYGGINDTLKYVSIGSASDDDLRSGLAGVLKLGLVRYAARTPMAADLDVAYSRPVATAAAVDKWDYWLFEIEGQGWFNGEKSYHHMSIYGDLTARRVTEKTKVRLSVWGNYNENRYEFEGEKTLGLARSKGGNASIYLSINEHWSAGIHGSIYSSIYSNQKLQFYAAPAVEYNVFPYSESTHRQLRFIYFVGGSYNDYNEETIFNEVSEWLISERLSVELELIQPWGSVNTSLRALHYFHDFKKNRLQLRNRLSLRLWQGFSLNLNGNVSRVRDQLALPKEGATEEDVLLRRQELATSYEYFASVGISYTFGSIYNNIVNPRFGN